MPNKGKSEMVRAYLDQAKNPSANECAAWCRAKGVQVTSTTYYNVRASYTPKAPPAPSDNGRLDAADVIQFMHLAKRLGIPEAKDILQYMA